MEQSVPLGVKIICQGSNPSHEEPVLTPVSTLYVDTSVVPFVVCSCLMVFKSHVRHSLFVALDAGIAATLLALTVTGVPPVGVTSMLVTSELSPDVFSLMVPKSVRLYVLLPRAV